jgi:hypothetical protein
VPEVPALVDTRIYLPALVMVLLVMAVSFRMFGMRVAQMKRDRIHPQAVATSAQSAARLTDSSAADNFKNLFEIPVLFYLAIVVAATSAQVTTLTVGLAWLFVILRVAHSLIHCTYNKVMHRFYAFVSGTFILCILWGVLGYGLLVR